MSTHYYVMHAITRNPECGNWVIYIEPLFFVWQTGAGSGFVNLWLVIRWRKLYQTIHTPLTFLPPLRGPSIGEDTGYLLQGIVHSLCRRDTGLLPQSRERNSMRFEVLTVGLKRIQVYLDSNAESTGKSFPLFREERSTSIFRACKSKSRLLGLLGLQMTNTSSRTAI
jgi:hypothetical protein